MLQHEEAPPNAGLVKLNPKISSVIEGFAVSFPRKLEPLQQHLTSRSAQGGLIAGVSSFGAYGTIAHAVLCQPPASVARAAAPDEPIESPAQNSLVTFIFTGQGSQYVGMAGGLKWSV